MPALPSREFPSQRLVGKVDAGKGDEVGEVVNDGVVPALSIKRRNHHAKNKAGYADAASEPPAVKPGAHDMSIPTGCARGTAGALVRLSMRIVKSPLPATSCFLTSPDRP